MKKTNGIIIVDKPKDYTSRDVVNIVSKVLGTKKVGHTGTLDPLATGVMVILYGKYTKLVDSISGLDKEYIGEIKLGIMTDTLDITGMVIAKQNFNITKQDLIEAFHSFKGSYLMQVPKYSAVKVMGKKLYEYARNNEDVELPVKEVMIYDLELLDFKDDIVRFRAHVSKGTYIRSLIKDVCESLGTIGVMSNLRRVKQGNFSIDDANDIDSIKSLNFKVLDVVDVLDDVLIYDLDLNMFLKVKNGNIININLEHKYILFRYMNEDVALYKSYGNNIYKVFIMY